MIITWRGEPEGRLTDVVAAAVGVEPLLEVVALVDVAVVLAVAGAGEDVGASTV